MATNPTGQIVGPSNNRQPTSDGTGFTVPDRGNFEDYVHQQALGTEIRDLSHLKESAELQFFSSNQNRKHHETQVTPVIVAVNSKFVGDYNYESLQVFGTRSHMHGYRSTLATHLVNDEKPGFPARIIIRHQMTFVANHWPMTETFAVTEIPMHGIPLRPAYKLLRQPNALQLLHSWGGGDTTSVIGPAWLIRMVVEGHHIKQTIFTKAVRKISECVYGSDQLMLDVTRKFKTDEEFIFSVVLSDCEQHRRMARQMPDLIAVWTLSQELPQPPSTEGDDDNNNGESSAITY